MTRRSLSPAEPLVERNTFRQRERVQGRIPALKEIRPLLPVPVFPEDRGWEKLYWTAWEYLFDRFCLPQEGSTLVAGYTLPKPGGNIEMTIVSLVTQLSGYISDDFHLIDFIDNFYASQHDDGFICRELDSETGGDKFHPFDPNSTGPNLLAFAEWRNFRLTNDRERIAAVFWPLMAYHRWCRANRTWQNGLYWTTGYASTLINQPRVPDGLYHHQHWSWIDASVQASLDCSYLERMAILLEQDDLAKEVATERENLIRLINEVMWNRKISFYQDVDPDGRFSNVKSLAAYWALLDERLVPEERIVPFVQHLRDQHSFHADHVLPGMVAGYGVEEEREKDISLGSVWSSLTYMTLRGLKAVDQHVLAHKMSLNHVDMVGRVLGETDHFWDGYLPDELGPALPRTIDETGKTPSAVIGMIIEDILGISVDWPLRQVSWRRFLDREQPYGLMNMPLGNEGTFDLTGDNETIQIRTDHSFTFTVYQDQDVVRAAVPAGKSEISLG